MRKEILVVSKKKLNDMHLGTLMSRRESLLKCEESIEMSDRLEGHSESPNVIEFKDSLLWKQAYAELKDELSRREHWPSKRERKEKRLEKAKVR